jgi:hypothetical protein
MVHSPRNFLVALQWLQVLNEYILTFGWDIGTSFRDVGFVGFSGFQIALNQPFAGTFRPVSRLPDC